MDVYNRIYAALNPYSSTKLINLIENNPDLYVSSKHILFMLISLSLAMDPSGLVPLSSSSSASLWTWPSGWSMKQPYSNLIFSHRLENLLNWYGQHLLHPLCHLHVHHRCSPHYLVLRTSLWSSLLFVSIHYVLWIHDVLLSRRWRISLHWCPPML